MQLLYKRKCIIFKIIRNIWETMHCICFRGWGILYRNYYSMKFSHLLHHRLLHKLLIGRLYGSLEENIQHLLSPHPKQKTDKMFFFRTVYYRCWTFSFPLGTGERNKKNKFSVFLDSWVKRWKLQQGRYTLLKSLVQIEHLSKTMFCILAFLWGIFVTRAASTTCLYCRLSGRQRVQVFNV